MSNLWCAYISYMSGNVSGALYALERAIVIQEWDGMARQTRLFRPKTVTLPNIHSFCIRPVPCTRARFENIQIYTCMTHWHPLESHCIVQHPPKHETPGNILQNRTPHPWLADLNTACGKTMAKQSTLCQLGAVEVKSCTSCDEIVVKWFPVLDFKTG